MSERIYGWTIAIIIFAVVGAGIISMAAQEIERDRACRERGGVMVKPWNSQPVCVAAPRPAAATEEGEV